MLEVMSNHAGKRSSSHGGDGSSSPTTADAVVGKRTLVDQLEAPAVQRRAGTATAGDPGPVHQAAAQGIATASSSLPHHDVIQRAFGRHDVSAVQAHTGADAAASAKAMGAEAYATGNHVVLGDRGTDLHTVAHEAAHVVQQRAGVQLKGGVGEAGDPHERHADEVADRVVRGDSAEALLDGVAGGSAPGQASVQRKPPRGTENRILNEMAAGTGSLSDEQSDDLIDKMDKGQTAARARAIAAQIEAESEALVSRLPDQERAAVRAALKDYVSSSVAIQTDARSNPSAPGQAVQALDAALDAIRNELANRGTATDRIVYRSISYDDAADIPYGQASPAGALINQGDLVGDLGFLSTSEHRQFVLGKEQTAQVQGLLKLAIHGSSGVPIAIDFPLIAYSNANQQALYDMQERSKNQLTQVWNKAFGPGANAGQAEVLFPRNRAFVVKQIQRAGTTVSVVLEEAKPPHQGVKNMKTGEPL